MIKKIYFSAALLACANLAFGQIDASRAIGQSAAIANSISSANLEVGASYTLQTPNSNIQGIINYKTREEGTVLIAGEADNGTFNLTTDASGKVSGRYIVPSKRKAYTYSTDASGNVIAKEVPIESLVCMDFAKVPSTPYSEAEAAKAAKLPARTTAIPAFSSKPNSKFVIYIDLDGEVTSGKDWSNEKTINALPLRTYTDAQVEQLWNVTAQDYLPWDVNVTTDRTKFDAAAKKQRKMIVVTKTNETQYPGVGGVAMIGSFSDGLDEVAWCFNDGIKTIGETCSHEIGHTVGLNHDGQNPNTPDYYQGHNNWAPIMGAVYSTTTKTIDDANTVGQWSKGEYSNATNTKEDDLNIIATTNGFGYEPDDFGNLYTDANIGTITLELDEKF